MDLSPDLWSGSSRASWWSRLKGSVAGVLLGLLLFVAAFPLLIWNEGRAVRRARALGEGATAVVAVDATRIDPAHEGALVYATGAIAGGEQLVDADFGVAVKAIRLRREVEMYQWQEVREEDDREGRDGEADPAASYEYEQVWSSRAIDSGKFENSAHHRNPAGMPFDSRTWVADDVRLGALALAPSQLEKVGGWERLVVPVGRPLPDAIAVAGRPFEGGYYVGDPAAPDVGDLRIRFSAVYPGELSVVARQSRDGLAPFTTRDGGEIELVATGLHSVESMFETAQSANRTLTWILRAVGFVLMFLGITTILKPLAVVTDVLPVIGNIIEAGTGIVAFLVAAALALFTIAAAWVLYRPLVGLTLLVVAGAVVWTVRNRLRARALPGGVAAT